MKISKLLSALCIVATASLASCIDNNEGNITTSTFPNYINAAFDSYGTPTGLCSGIGYTIEFNNDQNIANVKIDALKLPSGYQYTAITLANLPIKYTSTGWINIHGTDLNPMSTVGSLKFDKIDLNVLPRYISTVYAPLINFSYTIEGNTIYSLPSALINVGVTTVSTQGADDFVQKDEDAALYIFEFDQVKSLAKLSIQGAKFSADMPMAMNMRFNDIPFTITSEGKYKLHVDNLVPNIIGSNNQETPYPSYPISDLDCTTDAANNMLLTFTCTLHRKMGETEVVIPYKVKVVCEGPKI